MAFTIPSMRQELSRLMAIIIAISGGGRLGPDHYLKMAKTMGAHFIFEKPLPLAQLREAIHSLVSAPAKE